MNENNQVVGIQPVRELLNSSKEVDKILISRDFSTQELADLAKLAKSKNIITQKVPKIKLDKLSKINHQGILAFTSPITYSEIDDVIQFAADKKESPLIIILDSVTDTRNFGAICRTAECMGVHGIIVPNNNRAPITEGAIKSSAGAIFKIKIAKVKHLLDAVYHLQASDISVLSFSEKATENVRDFNPSTKGSAIILGSEDLGIHPKIIQASDNHLKIKMYGTTNSLNVGVAAAMIIYEMKNKTDQTS